VAEVLVMKARRWLSVAGWLLIVAGPATVLADLMFVTPPVCVSYVPYSCVSVYPPAYTQLGVLGGAMVVVGIALVVSTHLIARTEEAATIRETQKEAIEERPDSS